MQDLAGVIDSHRVLVLLGAGGVGKTTSSIVVALAAARRGKRVALLSIDPAKRLAKALGIPLSNELAPLKVATEFGISGTVHAAMLDQKAVFDQMVDRHAPSPQIASRIKAHSVYQSASTNLGGPLEYMALAKLMDLASDPNFDLVVLDTPPDTHALDFLARPNLLGSFMDANVMNWLIKPFMVASRLGFGKLFSASERLMGGMARVSGFEPLRQFAEFLLLMQDVIEGFHKTGEKTVTLLKREDTGFILVSVPSQTAMRSISNLATQLEQMSYKPCALLINRCLPINVAADLTENEQSEHLGYLKLKAHGQRSIMEQLKRLAPSIWQLHEREHDPGDLAGLMELVGSIVTMPAPTGTQK